LNFAHQIEGAAARAALWLLRRLGPARASNVCAVVARTIGPLLPVSRVADLNLRMALPELAKPERGRIVRGVWESLGRTAGELPHLSRLGETATGPGWELAGIEHLEMLEAGGGPAILFSAHIGNWEGVPIASARRGLHSATMYRPAGNPIIDDIILELRTAGVGPTGKQFAKGARGAREMLQHLRAGGCMGLLQDQKMNDGITAQPASDGVMMGPARRSSRWRSWPR